MEVNQDVLKEIYDTLEPYVIMTKLTLKENMDIKIELQKYNVRIYVIKHHWMSWGCWYRFTYKDDKIYMRNSDRYGDLWFGNIEELKDYLLVGYNKDFLREYYGEVAVSM